METEKKSTWGGARPGGGRPKGSGNKITAKDLLETAERVVGKPFAVSLLEGYRDSILNGDTKIRTTYEKMLLDKTASTLFEAEVNDTAEAVDAKRTAFLSALESLKTINKDKDE